MSGSDTPADLYRLFPVTNGRSNWLITARYRPKRPLGASTHRRSGSDRRLSDRALEAAVRVQKDSFCTTHASLWCALAARHSRGEKHPGLAHSLALSELKSLSPISAGCAHFPELPSAGGARHQGLLKPVASCTLGCPRINPYRGNSAQILRELAELI